MNDAPGITSQIATAIEEQISALATLSVDPAYSATLSGAELPRIYRATAALHAALADVRAIAAALAAQEPKQ